MESIKRTLGIAFIFTLGMSYEAWGRWHIPAIFLGLFILVAIIDDKKAVKK